MKNIGRSQWVETVGVVAIVISLVLVGIEIRQNTNAAAAQAVMALQQEHNENDRSVINDPELAELIVRAEADFARAKDTPSSLSSADAIRMVRLVRSRIAVRETAYAFYRRGMLDETEYEGWRIGICEELAHPAMRAYWDDNKAGLDPEFVHDADARCQQQPR